MSKYKYKTTGNIGLFDQETISEKLSSLGNPLEKLNGVIDFEMFRKELEENMLNTNKKSTAGCKPYDVVMMFKIILLKRFYNLSDEQTEYQISKRKTIASNQKTRSRVEHAFGFVTNSMNDFKIRSIGLRKAKGIIGLVNLVYNMCRYEQIIRLNLLSIKN